MRVQLRGLLKLVLRLILVALPVQGRSQLIMRRRIIRVGTYGRSELGDRAVHIARAQQSFS